MKICIDPGHGKKDPGAVSEGVKEKDINLAIAKKTAELLAGDYELCMTRDNDNFIPLVDRAITANNFGANIFISIHNNAANNREVQGTEVLHYPGSKDGTRLADLVLAELIKKFDRPCRGLKEREDLAVLNSTEMPAILIECGFLTNPTERKLLQDRCCQIVIAMAIKEGIDNYFER